MKKRVFEDPVTRIFIPGLKQDASACNEPEEEGKDIKGWVSI